MATGPIFLEHLSCSSDELMILDCPRDVLGLHDCDHTMDSGVQCYGMLQPTQQHSSNIMLYHQTDEDQCSNNNGGCQQKCTNLIPDYNCSCNTGYTLNEDGLSCDGERLAGFVWPM